MTKDSLSRTVSYLWSRCIQNSNSEDPATDFFFSKIADNLRWVLWLAKQDLEGNIPVAAQDFCKAAMKKGMQEVYGLLYRFENEESYKKDEVFLERLKEVANALSMDTSKKAIRRAFME